MDRKRRFKISIPVIKKNVLRNEMYKKLYKIIENFVNSYGIMASMTDYHTNGDGTFNIELITEIYDQDCCNAIWDHEDNEYENIIKLSLIEYNIPYNDVKILRIRRESQIIKWIDEDHISKIIEIEYVVKGVDEWYRPFFV